MRPDYRANLIHLDWCKSRYLLQHHMLGLTTEQKLLITPPPPGMKGSRFLQPDPVQGPLKSVQAPSAPVGLGSGPQWALSQLCCQNAKPFSIGFASLVWYMCEGAWGRGGGFWGFVFFKLRNDFTLASMGTLCKKRGGRRSFCQSHQLPTAASQKRVDVSITGTPGSPKPA